MSWLLTRTLSSRIRLSFLECADRSAHSKNESRIRDESVLVSSQLMLFSEATGRDRLAGVISVHFKKESHVPHQRLATRANSSHQFRRHLHGNRRYLAQRTSLSH